MTGLPSRREAEALLAWAGACNPGPWTEHSRTAARAAERIARAGGMDAEKAYVLLLLHDIGRYEGVRGLHHVLAGHELMTEKGFPACARVCLTHSFPLPRLEAYTGRMDCTDDEKRLLERLLTETEFDEYDRLAQLCDAISLPRGVSLMETRLTDVALRNGFNGCSTEKWRAFFAVKRAFDERCGGNVYALFRDEIIETIFEGKE
ncbi:MAG: HD domain-containing protein [Eubacteriales bacterium]|nr:HD domain-containing protein [Eubacteriales bacterium]